MTSHFSPYEVVSAGLVSIDQDGRIECSGKSTSFDVENRVEDDENIIKKQL
jgi:hypothetical protein